MRLVRPSMTARREAQQIGHIDLARIQARLEVGRRDLELEHGGLAIGGVERGVIGGGRTDGIGLGLAIACRAIQLHQGTITAGNAHPCLRVTIRLPTQPQGSPGPVFRP